jgi:hypothetical protein
MSVLTMRLVLGIFFLIMGTLIFTRDLFFPEFMATADPLRLRIAGFFAYVFGGLNLARWYSVYSYRQSTRTAVRYPLKRDPSAVPQVEPRPEFDFTRQKSQEQPGTRSEDGAKQ